jgi:hypothetical protein
MSSLVKHENVFSSFADFYDKPKLIASFSTTKHINFVMCRKIWKAELHAGHGKGHLSAIAEEKWNTQGMYCGTVNAGVANLNF